MIDAQLPRRMTIWLANAGCDAVHTMDLPDENRTNDREIIALADRDGRVVVTKDADFVDSHTLHARPSKLLLISTGNVSNRELEAIVMPLIPDVLLAFQVHAFVEIGRAGLVVRE